jgi:hypothetical protein
MPGVQPDPVIGRDQMTSDRQQRLSRVQRVMARVRSLGIDVPDIETR